jgi:hypothetical protein
MTPLMLQDTMVAEMKALFGKFYLKNALGNMSLLNVYAQHLPVKESPKDPKHYPYIVVVLNTAEDTAEIDPAKCNLFFVIGTFDDTNDYQGHRDLCNVIDSIYDYLMRTKFFSGFEIQYPITRSYAVIGDGGDLKNTYPYFEGGIDTTWTVGKITMNDPNT